MIKHKYNINIYVPDYIADSKVFKIIVNDFRERRVDVYFRSESSRKFMTKSFVRRLLNSDFFLLEIRQIEYGEIKITGSE